MPEPTEMMKAIDAVAAQNIAASVSDTGPTDKEMKDAWAEFKRTQFFSVLVQHAERADKLLTIEGTLWGFFYNGYLAGWRAKWQRHQSA